MSQIFQRRKSDADKQDFDLQLNLTGRSRSISSRQMGSLSKMFYAFCSKWGDWSLNGWQVILLISSGLTYKSTNGSRQEQELNPKTGSGWKQKKGKLPAWNIHLALRWLQISKEIHNGLRWDRLVMVIFGYFPDKTCGKVEQPRFTKNVCATGVHINYAKNHPVTSLYQLWQWKYNILQYIANVLRVRFNQTVHGITVKAIAHCAAPACV